MIAVFPGSFDPMTIGHIALLKRAVKMFDKIIVAVGINTSKKCDRNAAPHKDEKLESIRRAVADMPQVEVESYSCLTTDFCRIKGAHVILRGVRDNADFEYERKIADINRKFGLQLSTYSKDDYVNAMEDLLCDEYAMEFAFEGTRFSDLRRLALHKNQSGQYGGNFGDRWLSHMLQRNAAGVTTQNCYLPYK